MTFIMERQQAKNKNTIKQGLTGLHPALKPISLILKATVNGAFWRETPMLFRLMINYIQREKLMETVYIDKCKK